LIKTLCDPIIIDTGLFVEDKETILRKLDEAYKQNPFEVLVADNVSSQSGRVLPVEYVAKWCRINNVTSVIDGT
jgi:hypothetical protein